MIQAIRPVARTSLQIMRQFDVNELLGVYQTMLEADRRNKTDFAREQRDYIESHYVHIKI
jgi:hypothetical protein